MSARPSQRVSGSWESLLDSLQDSTDGVQTGAKKQPAQTHFEMKRLDAVDVQRVAHGYDPGECQTEE